MLKCPLQDLLIFELQSFQSFQNSFILLEEEWSLFKFQFDNEVQKTK